MLLLPANRHFHTWFLILPYALLFIAQTQTSRLPDFMDPESLQSFLSVFKAAIYGLAAMWLLLPWLKAGHPFIAFLKCLPVVCVFTPIAIIGEQTGSELFAMAIAALILAAVALITLSLAGWRCRRRYRPARAIAWCLIWSLAFGTGAIAFVAIFASIVGGSLPSPVELLSALAMAGGLVFATVLPFLVLSFLSRFLGERFKRWLLVPETDAASVFAPEQTLTSAT